MLSPHFIFQVFFLSYYPGNAISVCADYLHITAVCATTVSLLYPGLAITASVVLCLLAVRVYALIASQIHHLSSAASQVSATELLSLN